MNSVMAWALRWRIPRDCFEDLQRTLGVLSLPASTEDPGFGKSEAWAQSAVRLEASQKGVHLFRNNVGVLEDKTGRPVRYGLANDSKALNTVLKSGDLIGFRPRLITQEWVGHTVAQFVSREMKEPGWQYTGAGREVAQWNWIKLIVAHGGDACFATGAGTL